jgi:hypothetical protein
MKRQAEIQAIAMQAEATTATTHREALQNRTSNSSSKNKKQE